MPSSTATSNSEIASNLDKLHASAPLHHNASNSHMAGTHHRHASPVPPAFSTDSHSTNSGSSSGSHHSSASPAATSHINHHIPASKHAHVHIPQKKTLIPSDLLEQCSDPTLRVPRVDSSSALTRPASSEQFVDSIKPDQGALPAEKTAVVPHADTVIEWMHEGNEVHVAGSYDDWASKTPLNHNKATGYKQATLKLPTGRHHYKFIVDGEWKCSSYFPTTKDSVGNENNCLEVTTPCTLTPPHLENANTTAAPGTAGMPTVAPTVSIAGSNGQSGGSGGINLEYMGSKGVPLCHLSTSAVPSMVMDETEFTKSGSAPRPDADTGKAGSEPAPLVHSKPSKPVKSAMKHK